MDMKTALSGNELIHALNQQKQEQCAIFCARLNQLAYRIRKRELNAIEAAELLDQEVERLQSQQRGDHQ